MKSLKPSTKPANSSVIRFAKAGALAVAVTALAAPVASAFVVQTNMFSLGPTSILNVKQNAMVVHNGNLATLTSYLATGINLSGGGWWNGVGIDSSTAALTFDTFFKGVGILPNDFGGSPIYTTFQGVSVVQTDVIIAYSWEGDADLDGLITTTDQFLLDDNADNHTTGWLHGDFDYDGSITTTDQFLLDNAVQNGGADVNPPAAPSAVPEPSSLVMLSLGALGLLRRRHGRKN